MARVSRALWPIASMTTSAGMEPADVPTPRTLSIGQVQVLDPAVKADLAAQRFDPPPQGLDHGRQTIAAQVRAIIVKDRRLALALGEQFQHAAHFGP